jgi:hypothetical protein
MINQAQESNPQESPPSELMEEMYESASIESDEANHEGSAINHLTEMGNRAVSLKLIAGHGFHQGQYELLRDGQALLMTPGDAQGYLEELLASEL